MEKQANHIQVLLVNELEKYRDKKNKQTSRDTYQRNLESIPRIISRNTLANRYQ